jgi:hypothetical protein
MRVGGPIRADLCRDVEEQLANFGQTRRRVIGSSVKTKFVVEEDLRKWTGLHSSIARLPDRCCGAFVYRRLPSSFVLD